MQIIMEAAYRELKQRCDAFQDLALRDAQTYQDAIVELHHDLDARTAEAKDVSERLEALAAKNQTLSTYIQDLEDAIQANLDIQANADTASAKHTACAAEMRKLNNMVETLERSVNQEVTESENAARKAQAHWERAREESKRASTMEAQATRTQERYDELFGELQDANQRVKMARDAARQFETENEKLQESDMLLKHYADVAKKDAMLAKRLRSEGYERL